MFDLLRQLSDFDGLMLKLRSSKISHIISHYIWPNLILQLFPPIKYPDPKRIRLLRLPFGLSPFTSMPWHLLISARNAFPKLLYKILWIFQCQHKCVLFCELCLIPVHSLNPQIPLYSSDSRTYSFLCASLSILLDHNLQRNKNHISFFLYGPKELYINVLNLCTTQQVNAVNAIVNVSERVFRGTFKVHFRIILKFQLQPPPTPPKKP